MVEDGAAVSGHVEVGVAVVVEITDGDALAVKSFGADAGLFRHFGKRPVSVVAVKRGMQGPRGLIDVGRGGLDEVEVEQPVLIVINPAEAGAHRLEVILLVGCRRVLLPGDACGLAGVSKAHRNGDGRRLGRAAHQALCGGNPSHEDGDCQENECGESKSQGGDRASRPRASSEENPFRWTHQVLTIA